MVVLGCDGGNEAGGGAPRLAERLLDKPPRRAAVDWRWVRSTCMDWVKNPMNVALVLWLLCVGAAGGMFVLLLLGLLDEAFPTAALRNHWIEIDTQVLNALCTLMSVYQHPTLCHHLFLLCRWRAEDAVELRAAYCKDAGPRPRERAHLAVVLVLLHLTVVCQYVLCGLYWGYPKKQRSELAEDAVFALGLAAPVAAVVYSVCSPLGKDCDCDFDAAWSDAGPASRRLSGRVVSEPEWDGGMFDCGSDAAAGCLAVSCAPCVFGRNMERLGFGGKYVHIATFLLLCFAPFWVFGVSALHIHDYVIGDVLGAAGILLCAGGLVYGGYWRIQTRRRFGLPGSRACCGSAAVTDYARWLFCWPCALAQEARTVSAYTVDGDSFYHKVAVDEEEGSRNSLVVVHGDMVPPLLQVVVQVQEGTGTDESSVVDDEKTDLPIPISVRVDDEPLLATKQGSTEDLKPGLSDLSETVHDMVQAEDGDAGDENSVVHGEKIDPPVSITVKVEDEPLLASNRSSSTEDLEPGLSDLSERSWRVERVKKMINLITLVSLLVLLYTRGFIR